MHLTSSSRFSLFLPSFCVNLICCNTWMLEYCTAILYNISMILQTVWGELLESPCSLRSNYQSELSKKVWYQSAQCCQYPNPTSGPLPHLALSKSNNGFYGHKHPVSITLVIPCTTPWFSWSALTSNWLQVICSIMYEHLENVIQMDIGVSKWDSSSAILFKTWILQTLLNWVS